MAESWADACDSVPPRRVLWYGAGRLGKGAAMKYFDFEHESPTKSPDALRREFLANWTNNLADWGYSITSQSEDAITFHRKYRSWWLAVPIILLFPIGLLALLITSEATITAIIEPDDDSDGSVLMVNGRAPRRLRKEFARLKTA